MSDIRFALLSTTIIVLSYIVALSVSSLERVLAYVGSTGSTTVSFILPGLFYYKISDPDSVHHQRLMKTDDDADADSASGSEEEDETGESTLAQSVGSVRSERSIPGRRAAGAWRWRRKWRWDMEHISPAYLRRGALALAIYGACIATMCLVLNLFVTVAH
jgi:hypothetical protein